MYDKKIIDLIKSSDTANKELAVQLLMSLHNFTEESAKVTAYDSIGEILGETFVKVVKTERDGDDVVLFYKDDKSGYMFYHEQDCCECVYVEDINGDLSDLENNQILVAECITNENETEDYHETWTFYKFATVKGYVTVRWHGSSNGYYSESVYYKPFTDDEVEN